MLDIALFAGNTMATGAAALPDGELGCNSTGNVVTTNRENGREIQFENCDFFIDDPAALNGQLLLGEPQTEAEQELNVKRLSFNEFSVTSGNRVVRIDGVVNHSITADGNTIVTSSELMAQDENGAVSFSDISIDSRGSTGNNERLVASYTASFQRFATTLSILTENFAGGIASCPLSGELNVQSDDGSMVTLEASGGESLVMQFGEVSDTINCEEILTVLNATGEAIVSPPPFAPPPPPG